MDLDELNQLALEGAAFMEPLDGEEEELEEVGPEVWAKVTVNVQEYLTMSDVAFRLHFRMSKDLFESLVEMLQNHLHDDEQLHHEGYDLSAVTLMVIWILATLDTFRSVALRFGVTPGVLHYHYKRIIAALCELSGIVITWPKREERVLLKESVEERTGFPGVVGAVDGCHIEIYKPHTDPRSYFNRHHDFSIVLQAVSDENLLFRDVYIGEPGAAHDSRIFRRSPLCSKLLEDDGNLLSDNEHILGDGAYILTHKVLTPFRYNGNLQDDQRNYNRRLSSARVVVERAFGLLKGKWRRLFCLSAHDMKYAVQTIGACVVLHNLLILNGDVEMDGANVAANVQAEEVQLNVNDNDANIDPPDFVLERDHPLLAAARLLGVEKRNDIMGRLPV